MEPGCYLGRPMNPKPLKDALKRRPFRAFTVRLASGELIRIEKEHQALIHPATEKTLFIFDDDGGFQILDIPQITELKSR